MKNHYFTIKCTIIAFILGVCIMGIGGRIFSAPQTQAANIREKRVLSVMVEENDTIWTIANEFYTEECGSMKDYVSEIKTYNSLDDDIIYAGYPLIIPIWVSEEEAKELQANLYFYIIYSNPTNPYKHIDYIFNSNQGLPNL